MPLRNLRRYPWDTFEVSMAIYRGTLGMFMGHLQGCLRDCMGYPLSYYLMCMEYLLEYLLDAYGYLPEYFWDVYGASTWVPSGFLRDTYISYTPYRQPRGSQQNITWTTHEYPHTPYRYHISIQYVLYLYSIGTPISNLYAPHMSSISILKVSPYAPHSSGGGATRPGQARAYPRLET
jgi:hypothetical protein